MKLQYFFFIVVLAFTLSLPSLTYAKTTKDQTLTNAAEANFLTSTECEDVSVGVSVTQKSNKTTDTESSILSVFGSFNDICEFGSSTSFFGTTTVTDAEFKQNGVTDAHLVKNFTVDGNEIELSLEWTGVGVIGGEDEKIKNKETNTTKTWDVDSRNAEMTGTFVVNGLNRISDNSLVNAQLEVIKQTVKTKNK